MYEYDDPIRRLANEGKGTRVIAKELGINPATVYKILKRLRLLTGKINQHLVIVNDDNIKFDVKYIEDASETYLVYLCQLSGFEYCVPSRRSSYDLLVDFGNGFKKIQVKSSKYYNNGNCVFSLVKTRNNATETRSEFYSKFEVDYFFLYSDKQESWLIPFAHLEKQKSVTPAIRFSGFRIDHADVFRN